ncbi:MAG: hypothetical protein QOE64_1871 [Frankiales bacterium]|jgi:hypothetical protein|nr:hypothetical protein [Frankiales bacterium]
MYCPQCGAKDQRSKFCVQCGTALPSNDPRTPVAPPDLATVTPTLVAAAVATSEDEPIQRHHAAPWTLGALVLLAVAVGLTAVFTHRQSPRPRTQRTEYLQGVAFANSHQADYGPWRLAKGFPDESFARADWCLSNNPLPIRIGEDTPSSLFNAGCLTAMDKSGASSAQAAPPADLPSPPPPESSAAANPHAGLNEVESQEYDEILMNCHADNGSPKIKTPAGSDQVTTWSYTRGGEPRIAKVFGDYHQGVTVKSC